MKKNLTTIFLLISLFTISQTSANAITPLNTNGAGVYGQMQMNQIKDYSIEKNIISPVETMDAPKN